MLNLATFYDIEKKLPSLLQNDEHWHGLFIDYEKPYVERLWHQWEEYRIFLHRIHPCAPDEAFFHPHPWSSIMKVIDGTYEMMLGFGGVDGKTPSEIFRSNRIFLTPGCVYEMLRQNQWHYVRPLLGPSMSLMVIGAPWESGKNREAKKVHNLEPLAEGQKKNILNFFRTQYCVQRID